MKRLVISLVLLFVVLGVSYYGIGFVTSNYDKITKELSLGEESLAQGDYTAAKEHCQKAEKLYESSEQYMSAFVNHGILDDIGTRISAVAPLAGEDTVGEFLSHCKEAQVALKHLRNDHKFLIGNLF